MGEHTMKADEERIIEEIRQALLKVLGIDIDDPDDSDEPGFSLPHDENYEDALKKELFNRWKKASDLEQEILVYHYGLASGEMHSEEETASLFGVDRKEIRQIEFKVFGHRQRALNVEKLRDYINELREKKQRGWKYQW